MRILLEHHRRLALVLAVSVVGVQGIAASSARASGAAAAQAAREEPFVVRPFAPATSDPWRGNAIAYGPHRDGQAPWGPHPTDEELLEDLVLMSAHWQLLRVYGSTDPTPRILELIRAHQLPFEVLLGVWIDPIERLDANGAVVERTPQKAAANEEQIAGAIRLAREYPQIVVAISVGNETQVSWTAHRCALEPLIGYVRAVRAQTTVPVTVADDFAFWISEVSRPLAAEIDFVVMHAHPLWNGQQLEDAVAWTGRTVEAVRAMHPDRRVVLGETGWATQRHDEGEQATLMKGVLGEAEQARFHDEIRAYSREQRVVTFFFEAFDENWKGGAHPDEVEKHWGLWRADRTPKRALLDLPPLDATMQERAP